MQIRTLDVVVGTVDCGCLTKETAPVGASTPSQGLAPSDTTGKSVAPMIPTHPQQKLPNVERIQWYRQELETAIRESEERGSESAVRHFRAVQHGFDLALYYIAGGK